MLHFVYNPTFLSVEQLSTCTNMCTFHVQHRSAVAAATCHVAVMMSPKKYVHAIVEMCASCIKGLRLNVKSAVLQLHACCDGR